MWLLFQSEAYKTGSKAERELVAPLKVRDALALKKNELRNAQPMVEAVETKKKELIAFLRPYMKDGKDPEEMLTRITSIDARWRKRMDDAKARLDALSPEDWIDGHDAPATMYDPHLVPSKARLILDEMEDIRKRYDLETGDVRDEYVRFNLGDYWNSLKELDFKGMAKAVVMMVGGGAAMGAIAGPSLNALVGYSLLGGGGSVFGAAIAGAGLGASVAGAGVACFAVIGLIAGYFVTRTATRLKILEQLEKENVILGADAMWRRCMEVREKLDTANETRNQ